MITEKYPEFCKSENLKEAQVCSDCGERMRTRGELENHLGVDHNMLWDLYLSKVQQNKRQRSRKVDNEDKKLSKPTVGKRFGKGKTSKRLQGKPVKKKKINQTRTKRSGEHRERDPTTTNSVYSDPKLSLIPDENPYSRKFSFKTKTRGQPPPVPACSSSLQAVRLTNLASSLSEPYCSVCQVLLDPASREVVGEAELTGEETLPAQSMVWLPGWSERVSPLLVCGSCKVCVHQACYLSPSTPGDGWVCDGCQARERTGQESLCSICGKTGGALVRTEDGSLAHITCALLVPEVGVRPGVEVRRIPEKRRRVECLLCGETGRPAVHCQASSSCSLAFHTDCAVRQSVDIVIGEDRLQSGRYIQLTLSGTQPGTIVLRCSFCVEKFSLQEEDETSQETVQDLEVGETVTVTTESGQPSLAVVVEIVPDKYLAVAFDDGSYSDTLDPEDVSPISAGEGLSLNRPVEVKFEGGLYTGVYKGEECRHWYKVRTINNMDILEVERNMITKREES